jgi:hypothetical protein
MPKLNQINALVTGKKGEAEKHVTEVYKIIQKEALFDGRERIYKPLDEENGEKLPPEKQKVQQKVPALIDQARAKWTEIWDLVATQDKANQEARADIKGSDGKPILFAVPVTTLLYLEKQVNDLETFLGKLPTPDPSEEWIHDANSNMLKTAGTQTVRTKKVEEYKVIVPATKEHPAQVAKTVEDQRVGTWTQILYTGRIPAQQKDAMLHRVKELKDAIKLAREEANMVEAKPQKVSEQIFNYVLGA